MSQEIRKLQPQAIWENFYQLTQIPRPSKKEARIIEFMQIWGKEKSIKTITDEVGNVIMRKDATPGMENKKTIILQAHLDMVPQKNNDTPHNFETDPIEAFIDGEWVTAKGTTLGADNGMGVAAAMAVLEANNLEHGPIEALFTIDEETGMTGAFNLKPGLLKGDILLNLDSEDEGELYIGCAGGVDTLIYLQNKRKPTPKNCEAFRLTITGLKGGHSGLDIPLQRANANKVLFRVLQNASFIYKVRLASVQGGDMRNAIPREAVAHITVAQNQTSEFKNFIKQIEASIQAEFAKSDAGLTINLTPAELPDTVMKGGTMKKLCRIVRALPHGPVRFIDGMPGVPETSVNIGIVKSDDAEISIANLLRSSADTAKTDLQQSIESIAKLAGARTEHTGEYPGWKPETNSPILGTMKQVYSQKYDKEPAVKIIHAGLECGILGATYPNWDMISFGPTIRFPHSPDEKVHIESVQKFWDFLKDTLKNAPSKS